MDASELGGARAQAPAVKGRRSQSHTPAAARFRLTEGRCSVVQCGMWLDRLIRPGRSCSYLTEIIMPGCREQENRSRSRESSSEQAKKTSISRRVTAAAVAWFPSKYFSAPFPQSKCQLLSLLSSLERISCPLVLAFDSESVTASRNMLAVSAQRVRGVVASCIIP